MKCLRVGLLLSFCFVSMYSIAQSGYIMVGSREYNIIDRLQLKLKNDSILNFSDIKPFTRQSVVERVEYINQLAAEGKVQLSKVDKYNIDLLLKENFEYTKGFDEKDTTLSLKDVFSKKALTHPAYIGIKRGDFSIYSTWHIDYTRGKDDNVNYRIFNNMRALSIRGNLTKNLGYYSYLFEHQEADPLYVRQFVKTYNAVPGEGFYNSFKDNGYDVFNARGGIMFKATKNTAVQFAYDKVFIGDGYRSLILSDFSNNFLFLKLNTRVWKLNYHMLYAQLNATRSNQAPIGSASGNYLYPKKYMAFHQLDFQATKWLNIGAFENVMFGRENGFDLSYLNPIIFYRAIERQNGSPDKVTIGLNIKANVFKNAQVYSQIIINEFTIDNIKRYSKGNYTNKQALQLGAKLNDFLGVKNLDLQGEMNIVRPFVYSHYDTVSSFSHYNQPLAHPLGANFKEFIGIIRYQPIGKLQLEAKLIYYKQGLDSGGYNFGSNIFRYYSEGRPPISATNSAQRVDGFLIGSGILAKCMLFSFTASYEILPNLYVDGSAVIRNYQKQDAADFNTKWYSVGIRLNLQRRTFEF